MLWRRPARSGAFSPGHGRISHQQYGRTGAILEADLALILNVGPGHAATTALAIETAHYKSELLHLAHPSGTTSASNYPDLARRSPLPYWQEVGANTTSGT